MTTELLDTLIKLDNSGFIPAPGEKTGDFLYRVGKTREVHRKFDELLQKEGTVDVFDTVSVSSKDAISPELVEAAAEKCQTLYGFSVRHVHGFYLTKGVGLLWGGCMLSDPDLNFSVFLLRNAFKKHRRFLNYTRDELLAHELCHSVRQVLMETTLEEYFAYRTSNSIIRRYLGNCFIHTYDAILFLIPMLLLPIAQFIKFHFNEALWLSPFWIAAGVYPLFLLCRNALSRSIVNRARKKLRKFRISRPDSVLFRCTLKELHELGKINSGENFFEYLAEKAETELRWAVIKKRFIIEPSDGEKI